MNMVLHPIFVLLLLGHILGDFYAQSKNMAEKKNAKWMWLIGHGVLYAVCIAIMLYFIEPARELLWIFLFISLSHIIVDICKRFIKWKPFTIDQLIHVVFLFIAWKMWGESLAIKTFNIDELDYILGNWVSVILGLLIILRPIGVLIAKGDIWDFNTIDAPPNAAQQGAGKMIGYLERVMVFFLLLNSQYGAIAFVIAAKSVARFPEINKDNQGRSQAEYFLIGTLLSMVSVFSVALLLGLIN
jgi:hypothetical protein